MEDFIIDIKDVCFSYRYDETKISALNNINLQIKKGEFVSIVGRNGAGKSTLARLLNGILIPSEGTILINGMDTKDKQKIWDIRKCVGIVFQNPDNQIIGTTLVEEVAFGPENMGVNPKRIKQLVEESLGSVGLIDYKNLTADCLSGGQKQKLTIASVLAMEPECIIFDEAANMIDSFERKEILNIINKLNKEKVITIINITHSPDEVLQSDRMIVMDKGKIIFNDEPNKIYYNVKQLLQIGIAVPEITELFYELNLEGIELPRSVSNVDDAIEVLVNKINSLGVNGLCMEEK